MIVSGNGITIPADFRFNNIVSGIIGQAAVMPVSVTTGDLTGVTMGTVTLTFAFPMDVVAFKELTTPEQAGWTYTADDATPGQLIITATPDPGATLSSGAFVTPSFNVYLTAEATLPVTFTAAVEPNCVIPTGDNSGKISVELVCYSEGRLVKIGSTVFSIGQAHPNPAESQAVVPYSTGIKTATTFELVNAMGTVVRTITTPVMASGQYELTVPTNDLANGLYILRMSSGPFVDSRVISIVR